MYKKVLIFLGFVMIALTAVPSAQALRVSEFVAICEQANMPCKDVPILNAYVGGALDLIAALHEDTDYIKPIYCKDTKQLFDVPAMIKFIETHQSGNENKNTMLLLIKFLETYGDC